MNKFKDTVDCFDDELIHHVNIGDLHLDSWEENGICQRLRSPRNFQRAGSAGSIGTTSSAGQNGSNMDIAETLPMNFEDLPGCQDSQVPFQDQPKSPVDNSKQEVGGGAIFFNAKTYNIYSMHRLIPISVSRSRLGGAMESSHEVPPHLVAAESGGPSDEIEYEEIIYIEEEEEEEHHTDDECLDVEIENDVQKMLQACVHVHEPMHETPLAPDVSIQQAQPEQAQQLLPDTNQEQTAPELEIVESGDEDKQGTTKGTFQDSFFVGCVCMHAFNLEKNIKQYRYRYHFKFNAFSGHPSPTSIARISCRP